LILKPTLTDSKQVSASPSSTEPEYQCPICKDGGWVYSDVRPGHEDFGKMFPCVCQAKRIAEGRAQRMLRYCQLPEETESMTFDNFEVKPGLEEAVDAAKSVATGEGLKWLTLMSGVDRGKTHLAIAICRGWLVRGGVARYVYVPLLLNELREGFGDDERDYSQRLNLFMNVPLLVLDDLGVQKPTPWANEQLQLIVDYRYMHGLALVVTTNKPLNELPGDDEQRIASRLQRFTEGKVVVIDAPEFNH